MSINEPESILIPLWNINPSRFQPRTAQFNADELYELAGSIQEHGLINPVLVFSTNDEDGYVVWELIAGERRTRASIALRLAELFPQHTLQDWCARMASVGLRGMGSEERAALRQDDVQIRATVHAGRDMETINVLAVVENIDRANLSPLEEGRAYDGLMQRYGWSQREIAARVNKSQGYVAQRIGLLSLNDTAAEALSTRVINMTHARALTTVPEALQDVATDYVVAEVQRDDTPATTRQIEYQLRALSAFVDPARWEPNGEHIYEPKQRNRLAVLAMLVAGPYAAERVAKSWVTLRAYQYDYYSNKNLLTAKPVTIVDNNHMYSTVTEALGMRPQDAWQNHAHQAHKWCNTCIFAQAQRPATPNLAPYCPRWNKGHADLQTCEGWIGTDGPIVIPVREYYVQQQLGDAILEGGYTDSLEAYLAAYEAATQHLIELAAEKAERQENGPRRQIEAYHAFIESLPESSRTHSQAHNCIYCHYYEPLNDGAPCRFALNPLNDSYSGPRAPKMGVLYGPALQALPRCEMFTYRHLPKIYSQPGFAVDKTMRKTLLGWMKAIRGSSGANLSYWVGSFMWRGLFAWLCPNGKTETSYSWDDIATYIARHWDEIGDGGMATLIEALTLEKSAVTGYGRQDMISLLDLATGEAEKWRAVQFEKRNGKFSDWPDGWQKPWLANKPLIEIFDEAEMLDEPVSLQL